MNQTASVFFCLSFPSVSLKNVKPEMFMPLQVVA